MPAKDTTVWKQNDDGSWTRRRGENEETTYYDPTASVAVTDNVDGEIATDGIDATDGAVAAAEELGVDLATVTGTGAEGRITKADVEAAAKED